MKANYQYNDKFSGKGSWHDFASYGEMGNLGKVRAETHVLMGSHPDNVIDS